MQLRAMESLVWLECRLVWRNFLHSPYPTSNTITKPFSTSTRYVAVYSGLYLIWLVNELLGLQAELIAQAAKLSQFYPLQTPQSTELNRYRNKEPRIEPMFCSTRHRAQNYADSLVPWRLFAASWMWGEACSTSRQENWSSRIRTESELPNGFSGSITWKTNADMSLKMALLCGTLSYLGTSVIFWKILTTFRFWVMTPCTLVEIHRCFWGIYCPFFKA